MKHFLLCAGLLLFCSLCFGESVTTTTLVNLEPPSADDINGFISTLGGMKVAGGLGIVMALVQALMLIIKLKFADLGKWNLPLVMALSTIGGIIYLKITLNVGWADVLLHSQTIAAYQVLFHQLYTQFIEKKDDPPTLIPLASGK